MEIKNDLPDAGRVSILQNQIIRLNREVAILYMENKDLKKQLESLKIKKCNDGSLFDSLNVGDKIQINSNRLAGSSDKNVGYILTIKFIDIISANIYVEGKNWSGTVPKNFVNEYAIKVGEAIKNSYPVLLLTKSIEQEVFLAHYDETWRDRKYIRYCQKLGRDYPRKKNMGEKRGVRGR